jgi:chromosome segregation ATPase
VLLERGPVAIYQRGALLGQGLLEPLPDGATTSIPFAIERAVAVEVSNRSDQDTGRLIKIAGDRLTVEQFSQRRTTYSIRNGADRSTKLYIRHERVTNWEVVDPPEGSEQVEGAVLLPVALTKGRNQELEVLERTPVRRVVDLMSDLAAQAVTLYLEGPAVDAAVGPVLREALAFRERLTEIQTARRRLDQERQELRDAQDDVRNNIEAVRRIARASDLRDRLTRRLTELTTRLDELTNQIVELDAEQSEVRVRMAEALRDLTLDLEEHEDE